ncbi:hypothetical protein [Rurimicrobium arvi]|uniref:hypothetical protein n=1 Tax=Rurimicrobium arvi TaxID=2049916 RepID=UPI0031E18326
MLSLSVYVLAIFKKTDPTSRFISLFIVLGGLTEIIGQATIKLFKENTTVYNISTIIEWTLLTLYYTHANSTLQKKHKGYFIASAGIAFGVVNLLVRNIHALESNFLFFECMGILCLSLYSLYNLLKIDNDNIRLNKKTNFWIPCILILYQCGSLWSWETYQYMKEDDLEATELLHCLLISNSILTYISLWIIYLLYPKMKRLYV